MRRIILNITFLIGTILVVGTGFAIVDATIGSEERAAVRGAVSEQLDALEQTEGGTRAERRTGRFVAALRSLGRGVFFDSGLTLAAVLPEVTDPWRAAAYSDAVGAAITGEAPRHSQIVSNAAQSVMSRFASTPDGADTGAMRVYAAPSGLIAIRLEARRADLRTLEQGTEAEVARLLTPRRSSAPAFLVVDGIPLTVEPRKTQTAMGQTYHAGYTHLRFALGRIVEGEVITNAPDAEVAALLAQLDFGAAQVHFPSFTARYAPARHASAQD